MNKEYFAHFNFDTGYDTMIEISPVHGLNLVR